MTIKAIRTAKALATTALASLLALAQPAEACTRLVYLGPDGNIITARSMDWKNDVATNLWVLPRGIKRNGQAGPTPSNGRPSTAASSRPDTTSRPPTASTKRGSAPMSCGWWNPNIRSSISRSRA